MKDTNIEIRLIAKQDITSIVPLLQKLGSYSISEAVLTERVQEMASQNYQCLGIYTSETLIGTCGMWFQTRHYAGKSMEIDHVIIEEAYRNRGLGKDLMEFIYAYARQKNCNWIELNTYVHNFPSHKFYYNQGFVAKGYHFIKEL
ncbi:GNAT family N-acetyltransferase [Altibacter sp.]|uniref:GNAT family N-acetyltransferase n=1 Tax=Altibacter sp. TaxID=2024823 RepID=UPI0025C08444|nr:GNAT family N-acetyltransferase [Altibacter sp.]